ncbi:MAG: hypothetical protein O9301_11235 [Leptospira sp.]|nr:hypothetical protein [Leptospira sp.]
MSKIPTIFISILVLYFFNFLPLFSQVPRSQGWVFVGSTPKLYLSGKEVLSLKDEYRFKAPEGLSNIQELDFYLMLGEYYLRKKDKIGIANILYELRSKKGEYSFADALLTSLWKQSQGEEAQAIKTLDNYIQKEPNTYFRNLAKNMRSNLFQGGEDEKKSMIRMDCNKTKPYYSLCRVFRLQFYIDLPTGKDKEMHKHYVNIMRVSSPFFEDPILEWIPLLDQIDEDLPAKLAFLGFIREGIHFQNMIMDMEKVTDGYVSDLSWERIAFFQILLGDYYSSEESYQNYLRVTKNKKPSILNKIYLKLGALSFLQKNFKKSLDYYLKLDLDNWSGDTLHPFLNEPLGIMGVKDLVSTSIQKVNGTSAAIRALQKIQDPEKLSESDIWPKLRIAQLVMDDNPELSSKIADEIIYMAQGKGWRRLEYAATVLQGYNQIYKKEYRKSTIEFTKSRGILDDENSFYQSEFIRNFGFVFAHAASGKKGPVTGNIREAMSDYLTVYPYEDLFFIRNYRPISFGTDQFLELALAHLKDDNETWVLFDTIYKFNSIKNNQSIIERPHAIFQIPFVHEQMKYVAGFHTTRDSKFFDSTYSESRETESLYRKKLDEESIRALENSKNPSIFLLPFKDSLYLFLFNPKEPKKTALTWKEVKTTRANHSEILYATKEMVQNLKETTQFQIYLNEPGIQLFQILKKEITDSDFVLFESLSSTYEPLKNIASVSWDCNATKASNQNGFISAPTSYFDGSRILKEKERIHIWDTGHSSKREANLSQFQWSCKNDSGTTEDIQFQRLQRRIDYRTVPRVIYYSDKTFGKSFTEDPKLQIPWVRFWLRSGAKSIIQSNLPGQNLDPNELLNPERYRKEGFYIQAGP